MILVVQGVEVGSKIRRQLDQKIACRLGVPFLIDFSSTWGRFGGQLGAKLGPERHQKSVEKGIKNGEPKR